MKKIQLLIFFTFFTFHCSYSQNLIPNGDFEQGPDSTSTGWCCWVDSTCTLINTTVRGPNEWLSIDGSSDRLVEGDIPALCWDIDTAQSGKSYITHQYYDVVQTTLTSPLQKDSVYKLSYYAGAETWGGTTPIQPHRFYFKFLNSNDSILSPLINSKIWKYIDTVFIASANVTQIEIWDNESFVSGTIIDNIRLEKVNAASINNYSINQHIKIYPNPTNGALFFNYLPENMKCIAITDIAGQRIINYNKQQIINNSIDLSFLQNGIYFLKIETTDNITTKQILISK